MVKCPTEIATGRGQSLFAQDVLDHDNDLRAALSGARVCVIGGAGSIGTSTTLRLAGYPLRSLSVIDHNENALAALMRRIRAADIEPATQDIETQPLDFGSSLFRQYLCHQPPFDFVLNFAALKHVRTERDVYSAMALIETNVLKQQSLLSLLARTAPGTSCFSVSTDKAANPVSIMGASKRLMEHVLFAAPESHTITGRRTTARFANVAYSNGSLLASFAQRLADRVPLAAPIGITRYFVSEDEAADICILAGIIGDDLSIYVPRLHPANHLISMEDIARKFLLANGLQPETFSFECSAEAKAALDRLASEERWPLILTPADTAGEKPYEEFVGRDEQADGSQFQELLKINYQAPYTAEEIGRSLSRLASFLDDPMSSGMNLHHLKAEIGQLVPGFSEAHISSDKRLDDRI